MICRRSGLLLCSILLVNEVTSRRNLNQLSNDSEVRTVTVDQRNNYCQTYNQVGLGKLSRRDALMGLNVSIGIMDYVIDKKTGKNQSKLYRYQGI